MSKSVFKKKKGQGVVEYAGALVIGAAVVAAALAVGPDMIKTIFTNIQTQISGMFTTAGAKIK
jgi:Flp pilus assembly pilin Flp